MPNFLIPIECHDYVDGKPHEQHSLRLCSSRIPLRCIRATRCRNSVVEREPNDGNDVRIIGVERIEGTDEWERQPEVIARVVNDLLSDAEADSHWFPLTIRVT